MHHERSEYLLKTDGEKKPDFGDIRLVIGSLTSETLVRALKSIFWLNLLSNDLLSQVKGDTIV